MAVKSEAVMKKDRPSDGGDWRWFYIHTFGTKILRDSLSPYFRGIIHSAKLGDKASTFPLFWPSTWPFGGQNVPQSSNCAMSNRCHPPCFSMQIFRGSLLTRPQTKGRGRVVPQNRHFLLNLSSTCSSTCTISVPPRVHSIFHLPRVHSFSYAQPRTTHQFTIQPKYRRRRWY